MAEINIGSITIPIKFDLTNLKNGVGQVKSQMDAIENRMQSFGNRMTTIGGGLSAIFGKTVVQGLDACIEKASDLNESIGKSEQVFKSSSKEIEAWANSAADNMGMSKQAAVEAASTLGNLVEGIGKGPAEAAKMSKQLVQLSADLASFNNQNPKDVLRDIQSGLVGQVEPLRKYGVNLSETALKQQALDMGLVKTTKGTLPDAVKMQAAYALILAKTSNAQGDFARTAMGEANSERILEAKTADLAAKIGGVLLPTKLKLIQMGERLIAFFEKLPAPVQQFIVIAVGLVGALAVLLPVLGAVAAAIGTIGIPITLAIAAFAALGAAFATNAGGISDTAKTILAPVAAFIMEQFGQVRDWFIQTMPLIKQTIAQALSDIRTFWEEHGEQILDVVRPVWEMIKTVISTAIKLVLSTVKLAMQVFNGDWSGAWETVKSILGTVWDAIVNLVGNATEAVIAAVRAFVSLLQTVVGNVLDAAIHLGEAVWNGIVQGLANLGENLKRLVGEAFDGLLNLGEQIVEMAKGLGNSVLDGIEIALTEGAAGLATAAVNAVRHGIQAAAHEVVSFVQNAKQKLADLYAGKLSESDVVGFAAPTSGEVAKARKEAKAAHTEPAAPHITTPHYEHIKTGGGSSSDGKDAAKRDAARAAETDAATAVKRAKDAFDEVKDNLRKNGATMTADQINAAAKLLRDMSEKIAKLQKQEADTKLKNADPKNLKSAQAEFRGDRVQNGNDYKKREQEITDLKLDELKKRAAADRENQQKAMDAGDRRMDASQKNRQKQLDADRAAGKINLYDEEVLLRDLQSLFLEHSAAWEEIEDKITSVHKAQLAEQKKASEGVDADAKKRRASEAKDRADDAAREKADTADVLQYEKGQYDKHQADLRKMAERTRQIVKPMEQALGRVVDASMEKWRGFKSLFMDITSSVKTAFAQMIKQLIMDWAKLQLLGGARSGFGAGANASSVFGSLTSLFGGNKGAVPLGGGVGTPGIAPDAGGAGGAGGAAMGLQLAAMGGKRGIMGGMGGLGAFGKALPWVGGGLMLDQMLFGGKIQKTLFGGIKKLFRFADGGQMPAEGGFVAEKGTGGEFVVPRTQSMAIPVSTLRQIAGEMGGGGRGGSPIHVYAAPGQSETEIAHKVAWITSRQTPTARAGAY